ncbi:MAG: PAS domain S-box protein [Actinobacteria bacterium]|nr:PAS domain S-box protein [Actinomycetota bacterium]
MRRRKSDRSSGQDAEPRPDGTPAASARPADLNPDDNAGRHFRLLAEHAPVGLYLTDASGRVIYANPKLCADAALTFDELLGGGWLQGLHEDDRRRRAAAWRDTVARGGDWSEEYRYVDADGHVTWVWGTAQPIRDAGGAIVGYAGTDLDITDLKHAEETARADEASLKQAQLLSEVGSWEWDVAAEQALRDSEARYRDLLETLMEGIWALDAQASTTLVNPAMAAMLGYSVEEMDGRPLFDFMDDAAVETARQLFAHRSRGVAEQHEFEFRRKDGTPLFARLATTPLTSADGSFRGTVAAVADITDRKRAEESLREAHERLSMAQPAAGAGVWDWDMTTGMLNWSPEFFRLFGLPADAEASFDTRRSVVHPDDIEAAEARAVGRRSARSVAHPRCQSANGAPSRPPHRRCRSSHGRGSAGGCTVTGSSKPP